MSEKERKYEEHGPYITIDIMEPICENCDERDGPTDVGAMNIICAVSTAYMFECPKCYERVQVRYKFKIESTKIVQHGTVKASE